MVQVASNLTITDLSVRGLSPGTYLATIRERGDMSAGPESTGPIWEASSARDADTSPRGLLGKMEVKKGGSVTMFTDRPMEVWEVIGRSIVVSKVDDGPMDKDDADTLAGVIARSAGAWENDKTVCSCSGKTVWEEREEQVSRGML